MGKNVTLYISTANLANLESVKNKSGTVNSALSVYFSRPGTAQVYINNSTGQILRVSSVEPKKEKNR